jgi:hypothetical protein
MEPADRATLPPRTGATELTDDELLLMDFVFDVWAAERFLRRDVYHAHRNVRFTHGLDDEALSRTLRSLVGRGLFACETHDDEAPRYSLTPRGGDLWEAERKPDWTRYCRARLTGIASGAHRARVFSPDRTTLDRFISVATETRYYTNMPARWRHAQLANCALLPWKTYPTVHVALFKLPEQRFENVDWKRFTKERASWSCVSGLTSPAAVPTALASSAACDGDRGGCPSGDP